MKVRARTVFKFAGAALGLAVVVGIVVPYIDTGSYGERLRGALERALARRVEFRGQSASACFAVLGFRWKMW